MTATYRIITDPAQVAVADWAAIRDALPPGGHLAVTATPAQVCAIEDAGFEIRDSLLVTAPASLGRNRSVVLARRPLAGTVAANVLRYRAGALNIDGCRVTPTGERLGGGAEKQTTAAQKGDPGWTRPWMDDADARDRHAATVRGNVAKASTLGRWPANLVLIHDPSCQRTGTRRIKAITGTNSGRGAGSKATHSDVYGTYAGRTDLPAGAPVGLGDADGMETVAAWACVPGCPIAVLDTQTATRAGAGASRFFPTFPTLADLDDWLHTLLSPPACEVPALGTKAVAA